MRWMSYMRSSTKLNDLFRESLYMSKDQQDDIKKSIEAQQEPKDEIDIKPIEDQLKELIKTTKESSTTAGGGILGDLLSFFVKKDLQNMFDYRHKITKNILENRN